MFVQRVADGWRQKAWFWTYVANMIEKYLEGQQD